ncbi:glycosyltransferase [Streptomyces sp. LHD-70]|uniref:glycosyltransferase family 32 protein n=1 Tax=Streptomyces sp. LHD-70 TaxID=3072140 RepID=UPI00280F0B93|nr:glycosyltransferase [Streptomyces sp. LHD-70]MDQ8706965.1 glycosyltransferase [Streptomyces sp. LHD-70]
MIPNVIHLTFGFSPDFGGKEFSLVHYVCLRSMVAVNEPDRVYLYYAYEPSGPWWDRALELVTPVRVEPPTSIGGVPISHPAHQSDVVRLEKLLEHGGIYLDMDILCVRPFDDLLDAGVVLGEQAGTVDGKLTIDGLCNAVILARPGAPFLRRWLDGFDPATSLWSGFRSTGRDELWDEMSVQYPAHLARLHPDEVTVKSWRSFFWPSWREEDRRALFVDDDPGDFPGAYCHHLWETLAWRDHLADLTPKSIKEGTSRFCVLAQQYI